MLLKHRSGAFVRKPPYTRCDCWIARDVIFNNEYGITTETLCNRVVDIGANIGCFAYKILQVNPKAEVVCIEPLKEHFECLAANAPTAVIMEVALSWETGDTDIYIPEDELLNPFQQGTGASAEKESNPRSVYHCTVPSMTLQQILDFMEWDQADLLKLDCEMCEFEVFKHIDELAKFKMIRGEYHDLNRMNTYINNLQRKFSVTISGGHRGHFWLERK